MTRNGLTALQRRVLQSLADIDPPWTLTGGAALVGFHLVHRTSRDLDLFWRGARHLGSQGEACLQRLHEEGLEASVLERGPSFERVRVADGQETIMLDLVADPTPALGPFETAVLGDVQIRIDSRHEILVNKLCALLGRSEVRDLIDVQALLEAGCDLERALADAPRKDAGFSPVTLAWVLRGMDIDGLAVAAGCDEGVAPRLLRFRNALVDRVLDRAGPE